ncbi:hypothetical protein [Pedobacter punctiformis]|uniref:Lipoprotein n=1 Tax=Pedobacter punctiformis TaxID=3004097 RepID=A0ABT4L868_9SPHI|nr:hypothetical protein [Pedobacter sp. HCMS5-2]MCZ4244119.1 hypothetical protein [Pedobacter sp. HCMS5-2]
MASERENYILIETNRSMLKQIRIKNALMVVLLFSIVSCSSEQQKIVDLEKINTDFDVSKFYKDKLKLTNDIISTDIKKLKKEEVKKLMDYPMFIKDTLCYFKDVDNRLGGGIYIESKNDWMTKKLTPEKTFGYNYRTVSWNPERDTLAVLNKVPFPQLNMTESEDGDLVLVKASKSSKNIDTYNKLKDFLDKKYGKGKSIESERSHEQITGWATEKFIFQLKKFESEQEDILSFDSEEDKAAAKETVFDIDYLIFNRKYQKEIKKTGNSFGGINLANY